MPDVIRQADEVRKVHRTRENTTIAGICEVVPSGFNVTDFLFLERRLTIRIVATSPQDSHAVIHAVNFFFL